MELFEKITSIAVKLYSGCNMKCCYCFQPYNDKIKPRIFSDYDIYHNTLPPDRESAAAPPLFRPTGLLFLLPCVSPLFFLIVILLL